MTRSRKSYQRDSDELVGLVPLVVYLIVKGLAYPVFPNSRPSRPSEWVDLTPISVIPEGFRTLFPIRIDGEQWRLVVVPVLEDIQTHGWTGKIIPVEQFLVLLQDLFGPGGSKIWSAGDLWGVGSTTQRSPGELYDEAPYLREISLKVRSLALSFGY